MTSNPMPYMPPVSTERRMLNFDDNTYTGTPGTLIYKLVDALCGTTGAGSLLNQSFISTLQGNLDTTYGSDLDYFFGNIGFLPRSPAESYPYDPASDLLTSSAWNEVLVKDAWYRNRIRDFWIACGLGGTPEGIRMAVQAALSCDCTVFESWRYIDNFGLQGGVGRAPYGAGARNEVTVRPQKASLDPQELRLVRQMLSRIMPVDTIITVNLTGLSVLTPVPMRAAAANSTYFEVQKVVTATPILDQLPDPDQLPITLNDSEKWLFNAKTTPQLAPHAALNYPAHYGYYYLVGGGKRSPIDSVTYGTLQSDGSVKSEPNFVAYQATSHFTAWKTWDTADSPDNYPGGKFGIHPIYAPALNAEGSPYQFVWTSQAAYVDSEITRIIALGGEATTDQYRLPVKAPNQTRLVFYPEYAVAYHPPGRDSTVSASLTSNRPVKVSGRWSDPVTFVRS